MRGLGYWRVVVLVMAIGVVVALPATGIGLQSATAAPTTDADTNVAFTYLDDGRVTLVTEAGEEIDMGVTAEQVGVASDLDDDGYVEVPYVTSQSNLSIVDRSGNTTQLSSDAKTSKIAVGDLDGDGTERVFFVDTGGALQAASPNGSVRQITAPGDPLVAVGGLNDITGDEVPEVIYTSGSTIRYYNTTGSDTEFSTSGTGNSGIAIGTPRDFDGDGTARVPYVGGSNNVKLISAAGNAVTLTGGAAKAPVAGVNWTDSPTPEVLYFNNSGAAKYVTADGTTGTVTDSNGNAITAPTDDDKYAGLAWAQDADAPLVLANFTVKNQSGTLNVSFDSNEALQTTNVTIDGPDDTTLSLDDFNETASGDGYTYAGNYTPSADGNYTGTLEAATAVGGDTANPDYTDSAIIDTRFNVTDLNATANGLDINISFNATERLSGVSVDIAGAENDTLDLTNFSTSSSTSPYVYAGTYNASTAGEYNVTLTQATSKDEQVDDENLTDSAIADEPLDVWNFTLTNETDGIHVAFNASEQLRETTVSIDGPTDTTLNYENFTETNTGDGYVYNTTYETTDIGTYNGTLERAESTDGDVVTPDLTANATLGDPFDVTNLTATARNGDLTLSFNSTHTLASVTVEIAGAETDTLTLENFSTNDSSPMYRYTGRYAANTTGRYDVTLTAATADDDQTHEDDLTDNATIEPLLTNATLTDATDQNAIVNESDRVTITATVSTAAETVTADASAFGAGSVSLSAIDATTYRETIDVAVSNVTESRRVRVTVSGVSGREATDTTNTVVIDTEPPSVDAGDNRTVDRGEDVTLSPAKISESTTSIIEYGWAVDGTQQNGESITTSFAETGTYTARLAVTDAAGNIGIDTLTVTVEANESTTEAPTDAPAGGGASGGSVNPVATTTPPATSTPTTESPQTTQQPANPVTTNNPEPANPGTRATQEPTTTMNAMTANAGSVRRPSHNVEMPFGKLFGIPASMTVVAFIAAILLAARRSNDQ